MEQALEFFDPSRAGGRPGDPISLAVRQAEMLILSEPGATYSPASLARSIGVSARSLFRGFQRLRGYGPMEAVRRARLLRVRNDLLAADPGEKVTDVAMRWGFYHLGRFSGFYSEYFGELPSQTRRQVRFPHGGRDAAARRSSTGEAARRCA
jgi:transcriptional regulator GlxA family with amidase domain